MGTEATELRYTCGRAAVAIGTLVLACPAWSQDQHFHSSLPIVVNGADAPEKIPDHLAYAHFILSIAKPERPSPGDEARRAVTLGRLRLSSLDVAALDAALRGVHEQLDFIERETNRLSGAQAAASRLAKLTNLRLQRTRVFDETTAQLTEKLSPEGLAKLDAYVKTYVKPRIIIYGDGARGERQ